MSPAIPGMPQGPPFSKITFENWLATNPKLSSCCSLMTGKMPDYGPDPATLVTMVAKSLATT